MTHPHHHILVTSFAFVSATLEEDEVTDIKVHDGGSRVATRLLTSAWGVVLLHVHILIEN